VPSRIPNPVAVGEWAEGDLDRLAPIYPDLRGLIDDLSEDLRWRRDKVPLEPIDGTKKIRVTMLRLRKGATDEYDWAVVYVANMYGGFEIRSIQIRTAGHKN
jgi:hypothetical protein